MEDRLTAAAEKYERRIKRGFPAGELKSELLAEGYTEDEVMIIIEKTNEISKSKSKDRSKEFRLIIAVLFILVGIYMLTTNNKKGWWLILSALLEIIHYLFIDNKSSD